MTIGFVSNVIKHGEPKDQKYNGWASLVAVIINIIILSYGGFFEVMGF